MERWHRNDEHGKYITSEFESASDLVDYLKTVPEHLHNTENGYDSIPHAIRRLQTGSTRLVAEAEKVLSTYETSGLFVPMTPTVQQSVVGFMPLVPAVLGGQPETMLSLNASDAMSDRSPITIMVDCGVIATAAGAINIRGIAITALVMALQNVRPVKLVIFDTMSSHSWSKMHIMYRLQIPMNPPSMSQIAWMMSAGHMAQSVPFTHTNEIRKQRTKGFCFAWCMLPHMPEYEQRVRKHWDLRPQDIVLVGGSLEQGIQDNPAKWVADQIERLKQF